MGVGTDLVPESNEDTSLIEVYAIIKLAMENGKVGVKPCCEVIKKLAIEKKKENKLKKFPWWQCLGQIKYK